MKTNHSGFKVFVVEDNEWYCEMLTHHLALNPDYQVQGFHSASEVLAYIHEGPAVICLDYSLPDKNGSEVLKRIKEFNPDIQVIIISGQEDVGVAVKLLKQGAYEYLLKNGETKELLWNTINNIRQNMALKKEICDLKREITRKYDFSHGIIGKSKALGQTFQLIEKAAQGKITVSVTGETGTGKELVAKAIHYNSDRKNSSFVPVNVAAIPKELIESELFGHEKGAFTGAQTRRIGRFEEANGGTLFLDEIAEMDLALQSKLLRVLQEREITRVGGSAALPVDIRIVVATHKDLAEEVQKGNFREDLYYRLLGLSIHLAPLRERRDDILLIARHFLDQYSKENKKDSIRISPGAQEKLLKHPFPGNIRELKAVIELAAVMSANSIIEERDITFNASVSVARMLSKEQTMQDYMDQILRAYLEKYHDNVLLVAKKLDIGKSTIYRMLHRNEPINSAH